MTSLARSIDRTLCVGVLTVSFIISGGFIPVHAERGHGYERDRYSSPHWEQDVRHRHDHNMLEVAPYMKSSRIARGNTENQGIFTIDACLSRDIRKSALFNQAMIRSIGKIPAEAHTQFLKVPPYNGKRQVLTIRTTPPEIGISARYKTATIIRPIQEIRKPSLSDERSVSQAVAALSSTVESPSLFGGRSFVGLNPFRRALQLSDNASLHMNLTTTQALHGGNCAGGCP